jgi:GH24 family phage-related lysozyme (muramidase)
MTPVVRVGAGIGADSPPAPPPPKPPLPLYEYIVQSEGTGEKDRPGYVYRDHKGNPTIGVGHKLTPGFDPVLKGIVGKDYNAVISGQQPLTDDQMRQLFNHDAQSKTASARSKIKDFDKLPTDVQNAIIDGFFRGDLSASPKTLKLMNQGDFLAAAKEYLRHDEYEAAKAAKTGVAVRMKRNADVFEAYGNRPWLPPPASPKPRQAQVLGDQLPP